MKWITRILAILSLCIVTSAAFGSDSVRDNFDHLKRKIDYRINRKMKELDRKRDQGRITTSDHEKLKRELHAIRDWGYSAVTDGRFSAEDRRVFNEKLKSFKMNLTDASRSSSSQSVHEGSEGNHDAGAATRGRRQSKKPAQQEAH